LASGPIKATPWYTKARRLRIRLCRQFGYRHWHEVPALLQPMIRDYIDLAIMQEMYGAEVSQGARDPKTLLALSSKLKEAYTALLAYHRGAAVASEDVAALLAQIPKADEP